VRAPSRQRRRSHAWRGPAARRGRSRLRGVGHAASRVQRPHPGVRSLAWGQVRSRMAARRSSRRLVMARAA